MTERPEYEETNSANLTKLLNVGSDVLGNTTGAGVGFILGGPVGAIVGSASGPIVSKVLRWVGQEISNRHLSKREELRAGSVLIFAATEIHRRIGGGETIRQDSFFEQDQSGRSSAQEIVENIILKCQKEPQEKKISFMGHLLANLTFTDELSLDMAHQVISFADDLTFRQLCLLRIANEANSFHLRDTDYRGQDNFPRSLFYILYDVFDLFNKRLITFGGPIALGISDITPRKMTAEGLGVDMYHLMQLGQIPDEELSPIVQQLE